MIFIVYCVYVDELFLLQSGRSHEAVLTITRYTALTCQWYTLTLTIVYFSKMTLYVVGDRQTLELKHNKEGGCENLE